jgi:outer membrane protein
MGLDLVRKGGAILALVVATATPARPQAADPQRLGLAEALAMAEQRSPDYAAARARADAQDMRRLAAERAWWPRLSLATEVSSTNVPARVFAEKLNRGAFGADDFGLGRLNDPDAIGHLGSMAALEMAVDLGGTTRARSHGAAAAARAAAAQVQEARQELRFRVTDAYARAALAESALAAIARALEGARAREAALDARVAEGVALPADLLRARTRRRQREADLARARGDEMAARAGFAEALGAAGTALAPAGPLPAAPAGRNEEDGTLESWLARAREARALPRAAAERRASSEWAHKGERGARWPTVAAYASAFDDRWSGASSGSYAIGAALRWTFDPAQGRRVAAAGADLSAAGWEERAAAARVETEVQTAWARLSAAREALAAARGGSEEGREALRVVRERRASGLATLTDELETEAAGLAAEVDELRAQAELGLAAAALRRAAGTL